MDCQGSQSSFNQKNYRFISFIDFFLYGLSLLSLAIFLFPKSTLSDIDRATPSFFLLVICLMYLFWFFYFYSIFTFIFEHTSWRKHKLESFFSYNFKLSLSFHWSVFMKSMWINFSPNTVEQGIFLKSRIWLVQD